MYKRDDHYYSVISAGDLEREINSNYSGETDLVINLMSRKVQDGTITTRHELGVANEELWSLNDWPEGEGFGSSDHYWYFKRIDESIARERKFLQAEAELVAINKLQEAPKNDTVQKYMKMNEKLAEGLVA